MGKVTPKEYLEETRFAEFPDVLVTFELAMVVAKRARRCKDAALRECAHRILKSHRIRDGRLVGLLEQTSRSHNPVDQYVQLRFTYERMKKALGAAFKELPVTRRELNRMKDVKDGV